ncbi:MAG: carboxymuconolactone decarboxylase family protein, partial [Planctomycetota bacterium]
LGALSKFAAALHEKKGFVGDDDLSAFKNAGYDDGAVAEVVGVYALATFTNYFNHVNESDVDFPAAPAI